MKIRTIYRMFQALKFVPLVVLFSAALAAQTATQPQRIILTLTADPAHSMAVTWRSAQAEATPAVQVAVASPPRTSLRMRLPCRPRPRPLPTPS